MRKKSIFKNKTYAHIDQRKNVKYLKKYIYNPQKIKSHSFLPFILDRKEMKIFDKKKYIENEEHKEPIRDKHRNIMFSSHIDRYIYQLYNHKLNKKYNVYAQKVGIDKSCIAYRNNLKKMSNINFAHDVFDFILNTENCYIFVGDFKDFFEKLNHKYLKKMICKVLNRKNLPDDYYAVYKNITNYTYFDLKDICVLKDLKKSDVYRCKKNIDDKTGETKYVFELEKIMSIDEMKEYKAKYLYYNKNEGIPQGSSISSVLANIYMIDADEKINNLVNSKNGLYRRYSDDFIIVLPDIEKNIFKEIFEEIKIILKNNGNPELKDEKTRIYYFEKEKIININEEFLTNVNKSKDELDFLGFCFSGDKIKIRDKTMSKFYYRMYKKIKTIAIGHGKTKKGNRISGKELYRLYSEYGKNDKRGNFITYNERCEKVFEDLKDYFVSYKKRFIRKLKNRYRNETYYYKNVDTKQYYGIIKSKKRKAEK